MIVAISLIMDRIGEELAQAARDVEDIEHTISRVGGQVGTSLQAFELQQLDKLRQHVMELARFVKAVAPAVNADFAVDVNGALTSVLLGDLKHRLQGTSPIVRTEEATSGECELL